MHVIILFTVYLSFYKKVIKISKYINLGLNMINWEEYFLSLFLLEIIISF